MIQTLNQRQKSSALCPRCGAPNLYADQALNALSRRDNSTYICGQPLHLNGKVYSDCGTKEALADLAGRNDLMDWWQPTEGIKRLLRLLPEYHEHLQAALEEAIAERDWAEEYHGWDRDERLEEALEEVERLSQELSKCES